MSKANIKLYCQKYAVDNALVALAIFVFLIAMVVLVLLVKNETWSFKGVDKELENYRNLERSKTEPERIRWTVELMRTDKLAAVRSNRISLLNIFILSITALAVLLYTFETRGLRKETSGLSEETKKLRVLNENQARLQNWPLLMIYVVTDVLGFHKIFLRNVGEALAVKIDVVAPGFHLVCDGHACSPVFEKIPALEKGKEISPGLIYVHPTRGELKILPGKTVGITFSPTQKVEIYYENLIGEKFLSVLELGWKEALLKDFRRL